MKAFKTNLAKIIDCNFPELEITELVFPFSELLKVNPKNVNVAYHHNNIEDKKSIKIIWKNNEYVFSTTIKQKPVINETNHFANAAIYKAKNPEKIYYTINVTDKTSQDHKFFMIFFGYVFDRVQELYQKEITKKGDMNDTKLGN